MLVDGGTLTDANQATPDGDEIAGARFFNVADIVDVIPARLGIDSYDSLKTVLEYSLALLPAIFAGHQFGRLAFVRLSAERHIAAMKTVVVLAGLVSIASAIVGS